MLSVGYTSSDLTYQWTAGRGVNIASDMKLSQFDLISTPTGNETTYLNHGEEDDNIFLHLPPSVQETILLCWSASIYRDIWGILLYRLGFRNHIK